MDPGITLMTRLLRRGASIRRAGINDKPLSVTLPGQLRPQTTDLPSAT